MRSPFLLTFPLMSQIPIAIGLAHSSLPTSMLASRRAIPKAAGIPLARYLALLLVLQLGRSHRRRRNAAANPSCALAKIVATRIDRTLTGRRRRLYGTAFRLLLCENRLPISP